MSYPKYCFISFLNSASVWLQHGNTDNTIIPIVPYLFSSSCIVSKVPPIFEIHIFPIGSAFISSFVRNFFKNLLLHKSLSSVSINIAARYYYLPIVTGLYVDLVYWLHK